MKKIFYISLLCLAVFLPAACYAGPFGLEAGMSRAEVIQKIGKSAINQQRGDYVSFSTVPVRSIFFDYYDCFFDQNDRLWSIHASSRTLETKEHGEDLRSIFATVEDGLKDKYGEVLYVVGSRNSTVEWSELRGAYQLFAGAYWDGGGESTKSQRIRKIALELVHTDETHGFLEVSYEFTTLVNGPL